MFAFLFANCFLSCAVSENQTPINGSKRRKVATSPPPSALGKETLPMADGNDQLSSPGLESTSQENLPALIKNHLSKRNENADLWNADTVKARKAAIELAQAFTSHVDLSRFKEVGIIESSETATLNIVRVSWLLLATKSSQVMFSFSLVTPISKLFCRT